MPMRGSVSSGTLLNNAESGPESEPAPQAAPGSASEHDQRAPLLPYGIRGKYDVVDVGASIDTVGER